MSFCMPSGRNTTKPMSMRISRIEGPALVSNKRRVRMILSPVKYLKALQDEPGVL